MAISKEFKHFVESEPYKLVCEATIKRLELSCSELLAAGYVCQGSPFKEADGFYFQAMVRLGG